MKKTIQKRKTKRDIEAEKQLKKLLFSSKGTISIERAIKEANKRWPKKT